MFALWRVLRFVVVQCHGPLKMRLPKRLEFAKQEDHQYATGIDTWVSFGREVVHKGKFLSLINLHRMIKKCLALAFLSNSPIVWILSITPPPSSLFSVYDSKKV